MKTVLDKGTFTIKPLNNDSLRIQVYWPAIYWKKGNKFINLPTCFRFVSKDYQANKKWCGAGFQILGFGVAMDYEFIKKDKVIDKSSNTI